jgi:hypothetical protein
MRFLKIVGCERVATARLDHQGNIGKQIIGPTNAAETDAVLHTLPATCRIRAPTPDAMAQSFVSGDPFHD